MSENTETQARRTDFLEDVEKRVSEIFSAQKNEVEQSLIEKINREKEEAQRKIEAVNQEFAMVRSLLEEHKTGMSELRETEQHLRGEIRGHFERAVNYQKMMENAAALAGDELEKIGGLNEELEKVRTKAEGEYEKLKAHLGGYAGIMATIPAPTGPSEGAVDWSEEIGKLRQVRDLLATLRQSDPSLPAEAENGDESLTTATLPPEAEELAASLGLVDMEDDGVKDDIDFVEKARPEAEGPASGPTTPEPVVAGGPALAVAPAEPEAAIETAFEPAAEAAPDAAAEAETEPEPVVQAGPERDPALEALARYRRSEPINNGIEIGFYVAEAAAVLDAQSFMAAVGKIVDAANELHSQLSQVVSVKDLFLLKQEILNQQEVLRKAFFRVVRFCEKENGRLPEQLGEIIGSQGMKDVIERLTMANWSDPSDFKPFLNELTAMKRAFETRAASDPGYLKTVLDQVEGREN
jgi:hypothetical protein